jgi:hypothetical protein
LQVILALVGIPDGVILSTLTLVVIETIRGSQCTAAAIEGSHVDSKSPLIGLQLEKYPSRPVTHLRPANTGDIPLPPYIPPVTLTAPS